MANEKLLCWTLIFAGLMVQAITRRLDLLAILVPAALLLSLVLTAGCRKTRLSEGREKG